MFDDILFHVSCPSPELTWRDVKHLIAKTAKIPNPKEPEWNINAAGYHVHHRYCAETVLQMVIYTLIAYVYMYILHTTAVQDIHTNIQWF